MQTQTPEPFSSYLIRRWTMPSRQTDQPPVERFVVETVSNAPRRWGFDSLTELLVFLHSELLKDELQEQ